MSSIWLRVSWLSCRLPGEWCWGCQGCHRLQVCGCETSIFASESPGCYRLLSYFVDEDVCVQWKIIRFQTFCLLVINSCSYFHVQVDMGDEEKVKEAIDRVRYAVQTQPKRKGPYTKWWTRSIILFCEYSSHSLWCYCYTTITNVLKNYRTFATYS